MVVASCCHYIIIKQVLMQKFELFGMRHFQGSGHDYYMFAYQFCILMLVHGKKFNHFFVVIPGLGGGGSSLVWGFVELQGNKNCISGIAQASIIITMFDVAVS
jgi:hypothetical protein